MNNQIQTIKTVGYLNSTNYQIKTEMKIENLIIENNLENSLSPPSSPGSLSIANTIQNYNNVSTHTFKKTEWDVKKLENYVKNA